MTISYKWLLEYLPLSLEPEQIASILNSIGMEVEKMEPFEEVKGGLTGLLLGEVLQVEKHPNADKLSLTKVNIGSGEPLSIVCGAPNVAVGQKVVVAPVGTTIYPISGDPLTMRIAKIRGEESHGMICAEDEIGLGTSHDGILVLDPSVVPGTPAAAHFNPYSDVIFELGLTPNRSDAMSHLGVARDICAYLAHHQKTAYTVIKPFPEKDLNVPTASLPIRIDVKDSVACPRYAGITIIGVTVGPSPAWLKQRLNAIGVRSINNIVDITNYILHETGQPLHAFDASRISGHSIIVQKLPDGTRFRSLDDKERSLHQEDLMICDGNGSPLCMAGVFGGKDSGVSDSTTDIFLESAVFEAGMIRKTSFRHQLRTDAATRFEKNVDISHTVQVLKRAALLIMEIAGGQPGSPILDVYPKPATPKLVSTTHAFLRRISGKEYPADTTYTILGALGFKLVEKTDTDFTVEVPLHKTDISLPADLAEEVMRIDGFDNIQIPTAITLSPSTEENQPAFARKEKISNLLAGMGFQEILNNSITKSTYLSDEEAARAVRMMNSLSAELDVLRPSMLETGLQTVAHNLNHRNLNLRLFEFGKTYTTTGKGQYTETEHLTLFLTGKTRVENWHTPKESVDIYYLKGLVQAVLLPIGVTNLSFQPGTNAKLDENLDVYAGQTRLGTIGLVTKTLAEKFDLKTAVYMLDLLWDHCLSEAANRTLRYREIPKYPAVQRDLAFVVDRNLEYNRVENTIRSCKLPKLQELHLFDVFESEKLGAGKKSMALSFTFRDEDKTLTDKEIDTMMQTIIQSLEQQLQAEIRKNG